MSEEKFRRDFHNCDFRGIIMTVVMGMKTAAKRSANAVSKFGKFLGKLAEKRNDKNSDWRTKTFES